MQIGCRTAVYGLVLALSLAGAAALAEEAPTKLAPAEAWSAHLKTGDEAYAGRRLAVLKVSDALYLDPGERAYIIGRPGEPSSYRLRQKLVPHARRAEVAFDGIEARLFIGEENLDLLKMHEELKSFRINDAVDLTAGLAQIEPGKEGLRLALYDQAAESARRFEGLAYFPYSDDFRVKAKILPSPQLPPTVFQTSRGLFKQFHRVAEAEFVLRGVRMRLPLYADTAERGKITALSAFFTDSLTGSKTYGVGRYIDFEDFGAFPPAEIEIDFNYAYNPLCARSPHFNCPIAIDTLPIAVMAGEMLPQGKSAH